MSRTVEVLRAVTAMSPVRIWEAGSENCPDGVVAHHESLSSFRPGFESRSGCYLLVRRERTSQGFSLFPIPIYLLLFSFFFQGCYDNHAKDMLLPGSS